MTSPQGQVPLDVKPASNVPVLGEGFQEGNSPTAAAHTGTGESGHEDADAKKRHFWQIGKKKEDKKKAAAAAAAAANSGAGTGPAAASSTNKSSTLRSDSPMARSPSPSSPKMVPSSPGRVQSSPRVASPASSQIFERNVQEDAAAATASPAIPSHMVTEDHIPPVLDASSLAITDEQLNPDTVEIVTHAAHQPAAVTVATATDSTVLPPISTTISEDPAQSQSQFSTSPSAPVPAPLQHTVVGSDAGLSDDGASNYGNLDSTDAASSGDHTSLRESLVVSPAPTSAVASPIPHAARSPSPIRSPISPPLSAGSASPNLGAHEGSPPPTQRLLGSQRVSNKGLGLGLSQPAGPTSTGELSVETMSQALRKTGSGDLSGARSATGEDGEMERLQ